MQAIYAKIITNKAILFSILKWLALPLVAYALYYQLAVQHNFSEIVTEFSTSLQPQTLYLLVFAVALVPINLGTEALKWYYLLQQHQPITFVKCMQSVLAGIAVSIFTPKRVGEYFGRLVVLKGSKTEALFQLFVSNLSQAIANLIIGLASFIAYMLLFSKQVQSAQLMLSLAITLTVGLLVVFFNLKWCVAKLSQWKILKKYSDKFEQLQQIQPQQLLVLLGLSVLKYFIFIIQFVFLLKALGVAIGILAGLICAGCVFFVKTVLPVPSTVELAARGSIAIFFLSEFTSNNIGILVASIVLWFINLGIPAVIGSGILANQKS